MKEEKFFRQKEIGKFLVWPAVVLLPISVSYLYQFDYFPQVQSEPDIFSGFAIGMFMGISIISVVVYFLVAGVYGYSKWKKGKTMSLLTLLLVQLFSYLIAFLLLSSPLSSFYAGFLYKPPRLF